MPPPSLERKEQPLSRQQKDKLKGSFKPEDQPRRRSSFQLPPVPFTPDTKQNSYTEQFRRRRSQQEMADQSPRTNGSRRMERRRSSEDAGDGRISLQQPDEKRQENGYHHSLADVDIAVDKLSGVVAAVSGKGSDCSPAPIDRDQRKATMTKKRRAPCCRSSVILAVVAGAATVTVAGGLIICRLYPSSLAAASVRIVVWKVEQKVVLLFKNEVMPFARTVGEVMREKGSALLRSRRLRSLARAADALVEENLRGSLTLTRWTTGATVSFELVEDIPEQLKPTVSAAIEVLKLSLEGMQVHLQTFIKFIKQQMGEDTELLDPVRSFLLAVGEWMTPWFEWIGLNSGMIDESLSSDQFLSPLEENRATVQSIGKSITEQESQVLQDVKRLEKRRVTIASDTNEILSKTRDFALESVHSVKMAALDAIELRLKKLEEQYARSFEQALKENEQTAREVEREGGAELVMESQPRATAATILNQYLVLEDKNVGEKVAELVVTDEREASDIESRDEHATYHAEEEQESVTLPAVPTEQSSSEGLDLDDDEKIQTVVEIATEDHVIIDQVDTLVIEPIPVEASLENQDLAEEHGSGSIEDALDADHFSEDEALIVEDNDATDTEVATDEEEQSFVTEVFVDLNNGVVENTHSKVATFDLQNLSEQDALTQEKTYSEKDRLHVVVPGEGTDMELDVEIEKVAYENTEQVAVDRAISDVRTRVAIQEEKKVEGQQCDELTPPAGNVFVYEEILVAGDIEQSEKVVADVMLEVEKDVKVDTVITALEHVGETDSNSHLETTVKQEIPERDISLREERITGDIRLEETVDGAVRDQQALEVKVIQEELEQLEQVLLKEEGERVEEELRAIAEDEVFWSRIEELPADEAIKENAGLTDNWPSSLGVSTSALPRSISTQIGLLSVVFIGLAVLTAYLLVRYRKRGLPFRSPRRRRRWRKLADIDAEVVVLLPEASSDEEGDDEQKASKVDVLELVSSISVKTTTVLTSDDEKVDEEDKTFEKVEAQGKTHQEEEKATPGSESMASRTNIVEVVQTTVENTATPTSADSIDTTHASVSPLPASKLQTPDTSQRTRRRHQIRT